MLKRVNTMGCFLLLGIFAFPVEAEFSRCSEICKNDDPDPFAQSTVQCNTACTYADGAATTCGAAGYGCKQLPGTDTEGGNGGGNEGGGGEGESTGGSPGYGELLSHAAGAWVWQSSTAWGGDAYRAVDGNPDGDWAGGSVTHTDINVRPEWHIYANGTYKSVTIYNRTDCCGERLGGASVWVRHWDKKSETYKWRKVATIGTRGKNPGRTIHVSFWGKLPNHFADALAIMLPEGSKVPLSLAEVELWGCGGPYTCVE